MLALRLLATAAFFCSARAVGLCVAENGGHGETPPPMGSVTRVNVTSGAKTLVADNLEDPVWIDTDGAFAYVGLFHAGEIARIDLADGSTTTLAHGLSCPEGVALDGAGNVWVVENPVGDECKGTNLTDAAHLTRVNLSTGTFERTLELRSPHGLAVSGGAAYVCEFGAHALTRIDLAAPTAETRVAALYSPSGCAVDQAGDVAFAVEQGETDGALVRVALASGEKTTVATGLAAPMGVAVVGDFVYVGERGENRIRRLPLAGNGDAEVFVENLNSPIGLSAC